MQERGNRSMGFDQSKTTHHFRSLEDGGAIEVTVNDPADSSDLAAIRNHLAQIAKQFAAGDFSAPIGASRPAKSSSGPCVSSNTSMKFGPLAGYRRFSALTPSWCDTSNRSSRTKWGT